MSVVLDTPEQLGLEQYRRVVHGGERVELAPDALARVDAGCERLRRLLADGGRAYGVTTGLGYVRDIAVDPDDQPALQRALVTARAAGLGEPLPAAAVRGVMLLRLNGFLSGLVGVGTGLCMFLAGRLNDGWAPVVPSGPYGAAGEIGALAHLFQTFVGEGRVTEGDDVVEAAAALARRSLVPFELGPKEGLALINGSPFATALGLEATRRLRTLVETATVAAALAVELTGASARPFSSRVGALSRDPAQAHVQERMLTLLGSERLREDPAQPPVSFRVVPQVHGAALDVLDLAESRLAARIGGVTDSPLVLPTEGDEPEGLYPSGAFHAAGPALWLDSLGAAAAHLVNLIEKRLHRLLDARFSGLPDQLAVVPGRHAGVVSLHKAVVGLAAEARLLAVPTSVHALDTSSGQEDVQAFTFLGFDRLERSLDGLETALGCELVALRQAAHLRGQPLRPPLLAVVTDVLGEELEPVLDDRSLSGDVERARSLVRSGRLVAVG